MFNDALTDLIDIDLIVNTEVTISIAYARLADARKLYHEAHIAATTAQADVEAERNAAILNAADTGESLGKNEAEREARLKAKTARERMKANTAAQVEASARLALDLALDEVSRIKLLAAVLEMSA